MVEHVTENHGVGGSIPPLGTRTIILSVPVTISETSRPAGAGSDHRLQCLKLSCHHDHARARIDQQTHILLVRHNRRQFCDALLPWAATSWKPEPSSLLVVAEAWPRSACLCSRGRNGVGQQAGSVVSHGPCSPVTPRLRFPSGEHEEHDFSLVVSHATCLPRLCPQRAMGR